MQKCFLLLVIILPFFSSVQAHFQTPLKKDGIVRFYVYHLDEFTEIRYLDEQGQWRPQAEDELREIFRSRGDEKTFALDHRLIELADHLQDHFDADTVEVISAYRSPEFNRKLKSEGRNVANESFHTKGLAMDIHLDEIREDTLRDYLLSLKLGGVGYYGSKLMVHMDFGPVRQWQDGGFRENTEIGIFNEKNPVKIRTDKLNYKLGERSRLRRFGIGDEENLILQKFYRGRWSALKETQPASYGKYRFRYEKNGTWQHSNEFYVKKL